MPNLQTTPLAILCSDLHLRETTPRARAESDWYGVMELQLNALQQAASDLDNLPIICAGDVFDKWNPSAELVNFAIAKLPPIFAIPGQHDLRYHAYEERHRGAYGALCKARKITDLIAGEYNLIRVLGGKHLWVWAMPWSKYELPKPKAESHGDLRLGVLHQYRWCNQLNKHAMADDTSRIDSLFPGLDALLIGDNHIPWELPRILNHGGFIPQNADQRDYVPHYGVLYGDGHIERKPYDVPAPQWVEEWIPEAKQSVADGLIEELQSLETTSDSFLDILRIRIESEVNDCVRSSLQDIYDRLMENA
jgi:hypothetical protein